MSHLVTWKPEALALRLVASTLDAPQPTMLLGGGRAGRVRRAFFSQAQKSLYADRIFSERDFDLVHAHFGPDGALVAPTAKRAGVPLIVTFHGFDATSLINDSSLYAWSYRRRLRGLFDYATVLIAVSDFIAERLLALGAPRDRVVVHHIGVPIGERVANENSDGPILFVGRLVEKKGVSDLLDAVAALPAHLRRWPLEVIGDGPLRAELASKASLLGLNVKFLGARPVEEVRDRMLKARIFAAPSKTAKSGDSEGLPTTIQEAAALSLPIISTRHAGIPEVIRHDVTGLLCEESDVQAMADGLARLLGDPITARRLGVAARAHVEASFNIVTQTRELERIYTAAAEKRSGGYDQTSITGN